MIQLREYAKVTCDPTQQSSIDLGVVTQATFDWLLELQSTWRDEIPLLHVKGKQWLKFDSYVGYLESPAGESIEILPKTQYELAGKGELASLRHLLRKMLMTAMGLKPREVGVAHLKGFNEPLHEWIIGMFLSELASLVKRGIRSDYHNIEEENRFIRGQLDMARQVRQRPGRATWFHIKHDIYSPETVENRLLSTAVGYVRNWTNHPDNWRLANELSLVMDDIQSYTEPVKYLSKWRSGKLMHSYEMIKPWCQLVIQHLNPKFQKGRQNGISLLFPMERLFESFVTNCLRKNIPSTSNLKPQASSAYLVEHRTLDDDGAKEWFQLKPDLLLKTPSSNFVLDMKWKLIDSDAANANDKYKISQPDMYQLFAYGHKYLDGKGHMMLIYPRHLDFSFPLPQFSFSNELHLWAVPFDCHKEELIGGEWESVIPELAFKINGGE